MMICFGVAKGESHTNCGGRSSKRQSDLGPSTMFVSEAAFQMGATLYMRNRSKIKEEEGKEE